MRPTGGACPTGHRAIQADCRENRDTAEKVERAVIRRRRQRTVHLRGERSHVVNREFGVNGANQLPQLRDSVRCCPVALPAFTGWLCASGM
jgi:hypothetical protein